MAMQCVSHLATPVSQRCRAARPALRAASLVPRASAGRESSPGGWSAAGGATALALAAALQLGSPAVALANGEFDILSAPAPVNGLVLDDAKVLTSSTQGELKGLLADIADKTGYNLNVVTVRKLAFAGDAFEFADSVIEKWYPTKEAGDKQGVLVLVTTAKEGALVGGPAFVAAVGDSLIDSLVTNNVPILAGEEKFNEAVLSSVKRIEAKLEGKADPGAPSRQAANTGSNFKTREETDAKRNQFSGVVLGLLVIAFVVPMVQYFAYTTKE